MPFGYDNEYANWDACIQANQDKDDPEAYCGWLQRETKKRSRIRRSRLPDHYKPDRFECVACGEYFATLGFARKYCKALC